MTSSAIFFIFLLLSVRLATSSDDLDKETEALIYFITHINISGDAGYDWEKFRENGTKVCHWKGVLCGMEDVSVVSLRMPAASLLGEIPQNIFGNLTALHTLSLHTNGLSGLFPDDFAKLQSLKYVYLHNNDFSGPFPSSVAKWTKLIHLDLSGNNFHGRLPNNLPSSIISENFSVSNNNFIGPIPENIIKKFNETAFSGNVYLCSNLSSTTLCTKLNTSIPWQSKASSDSPSLSNNKKKKLCTAAIVAIAIGSALILIILFLCLGKKLSRAVKETNEPGVATKALEGAGKVSGSRGEAGTSSSKDDVTGASVEGERMMGDMTRDETDERIRQSSDDHTPPTELRNPPNTVTP